MGEESTELIMNEKTVNWTEAGLVKDHKKEDPQKKVSVVETKKDFKIFDDMNIFRKPEKAEPKENPEEKRKKEQAQKLANMMFV